ncbi:hypothetical protein WJX74_000275 [Apatococcus lobatus]|uniref:NF-kappa-B inhibitor-like protein 1 n=1 Tax=Apatococcus lobatus TaxID=904363 RepID=A0AAW1RRL8_9CHLO
MSGEEGYLRPNKRHKSSRSSDKPARLQRYAALGDSRKVEQILHKNTAAIHDVDFEGSTALHQAVRHGHLNVLELLLSAGADTRAQDFRGNTPAHTAASRGHLQLLSHLLKVPNAPDVAQRNAAGQSIEDLAEAFMVRAEQQSRQPESPRASPSSPVAPGSSVWWDDGDENQDGQQYAWEQRLMDEALDAAAGVQTDDWYMYDDPTSFFGGSRPAEGEDEDSYAQRIWEVMTRRKQRSHYAKTSTPGSATAAKEEQEEQEPMIGPKPASAAERKAQAAAEAKERSDRILEEERAKDRAWRQAVLMGDLGAQRARYEARWATLISQRGSTKLLSFTDIAWAADGSSDPDRVKSLVLYGTNGTKEARKRLQAELMRWHPDKFTAHWGPCLMPVDRQRVMDKVQETSQILTALLSSA